MAGGSPPEAGNNTGQTVADPIHRIERDRSTDQTAADPARRRERDRDTGQTAADPVRHRERDEKIIIGAGPSGAKKNACGAPKPKNRLFFDMIFSGLLACWKKETLWPSGEQPNREQDRDTGQTAADPIHRIERDRSTDQTAADPVRRRERDRDTGQTVADPAHRWERDRAK